MDGLMMDFQLTLPHLLRRSETLLGNGEIVTRLPDKSLHRTTYRETMARSRQLAVALQKLGLERVNTSISFSNSYSPKDSSTFR